MNPGELLLILHEHGVHVRVDGAGLYLTGNPPDELRAWVMHWRGCLHSLVAITVPTLCHGMTAAEREAFEERAAILEADGGYPRELAERAAVWWTRTQAQPAPTARAA